MGRRLLGRMIRQALQARGWSRGAAALAALVAFGVLAVITDRAPRFSERMGEIGAAPQPAAAQSRAAPGAFAYYVLALSWSPSYCAGRPDARQCGRGLRFIAHGLWPQNERGYPQDCPSPHPAPSRALLDAFRDVTGSRGLLAHQWRKHGTCTGLSPRAYFEAMRAAKASVRIPESLARIRADQTVSARSVERAFVAANPGLGADMVTIKCGSGRLREVRLCLTKDLTPRVCGPDVIRDCRAARIGVPAPK